MAAANHQQNNEAKDYDEISILSQRKDEVLRQDLGAFQIFFIVISTVIGSGIFSGNGEALRAAGPGGLMVAITVIGLTTIAMLEGLSELIQLFAAPNALVEYVRYFVDDDLAILVGFAYWISYASTLQIQSAAGANFAQVLGISQGLEAGVFYVAWPLSILLINLFPVKYFGWLESVGGALKLVMLAVITFILFYLAGQVGNATEDLGAGFRNDGETLFWFPALCLVTEFVAFSFIGLEVVGITAYEARDLKDLRRPSKTIGYIVLILYLIHTFSEIMVVAWDDSSLEIISNDVGQTTPVSGHQTLPILIVAAKRALNEGLVRAFTGLLIYSSWSASNISLYVASRTLYGLARGLSYRGAPWTWLREPFGTGVPVWSVIVSTVFFWWIPMAQLANTDASSSLIDIMNVLASVSILFVWAATCLAYWRFYTWSKKRKYQLVNAFARYNRWDKDFGASTLLPKWCQPVLAIFALLSCLVIMFIFTTSLFWIGQPQAKVVVAFMAMPTIIVLAWLALKVHRYFALRRPPHRTNTQKGFWWVDTEETDLLQVIEAIVWLKNNQRAADEFRLQHRNRD